MQDHALRAHFERVESLPESARIDMPIVQREYLVGGELRSWEGSLEDVLSPVCDPTRPAVTPRLLGHYPMLKKEQALDALDAAREAWRGGRGVWPTLSLADRIMHVQDFTHRMLEVREEVVRLIMWEIGKTRADAEKEFDRTVEYIRDTIDAVRDLDHRSARIEVEAGVLAQVRRAPLGVVLCMGPFNYPLNETFTTLIPALIMGNTVVFKPPKLGVLLHRPLLEAFRDAFPPGVVNTVYGDGPETIGPMMESGGVDVLAFIGSSRVATIIRRQHPEPHRLRCILGLEAKNPAVVLPDADLDLALDECTLGALSFNGQRCTALKLLFVHDRIHDAFIEGLAARLKKLKLGLPWEEEVDITPLPEPGKVAYLTELVKDAEKKGARVVTGGRFFGTLYQPTLIEGVTPEMRVYDEEQFGPLVPVVRFGDVEEPIRHVIESDYGQQISLFGQDPETLARLIDPLVNQVCRVNLNSQCQRGPDTLPFTGRKDSAEGTLSVSDALRAFSIRTLVAAKTTDANKTLVTRILRERHSKFLSTDFLL